MSQQKKDRRIELLGNARDDGGKESSLLCFVPSIHPSFSLEFTFSAFPFSSSSENEKKKGGF